MTSAQIKNEFAKLDIHVRVRTIPSVRPNKWIEARIPWDERGHTGKTFPEPLRRKALAVVYGPEFALKQSAGGNVGAYSITLFASQWEQLFDPHIVFPL